MTRVFSSRPNSFEGRQNAAHAFVHAFDHGRIDGIALALGLRNLFVLGDHLRLGLQGRMHGIVGKVQKERPVLVLADDLHRLVGQAIRQILARLTVRQHVPLGAQSRGGNRPVALVGIEVVARCTVRVPTDIDIEPVMLGQRERRSAQMPFADTGRVVTGLAQRLGDRDLLQRQSAQEPGLAQTGLRVPPPVRRPVGHQQTRGVFPGQDRGSRRRTNRAGGIRVGEPHALGGQPIDVRRPVVRAALAAQVHPAQIVDQKQHDVVALRLGGWQYIRQSENQRGQDQKPCHHDFLWNPQTVNLTGCAGICSHDLSLNLSLNLS
jgi:hypothetical protein